MPLEIRTVPEPDLRRWIDVIESAFADEMSDERWPDFQRLLEPQRAFGAYDGESIVGGGATYSLSLTVPGGAQLAAGGVTAVGVLPTHRRQGMLNQLMRRQLEDCRQRREPLAILWASEGSIYGRYGYGLASLAGNINIERERTAFRQPVEQLGGVRLVERAEAAERFPQVYDVVASRTAGFLARSRAWWEADILSDYGDDRRGRSRKFLALHERDGTALGYAIYRVKRDWAEAGSKSVLEVQEVIGADAQARLEIWRYLFGVDLIDRIEAWLGPADEPLLLALAEPRRLRLRLRDGLWLRVLDVPAALEARSYRGDGSLLLDIRDELALGTGGRWRLDVADGRASVSQNRRSPDLQLDISDLAAVYLGAFSFAQLAAAGRTREHAPGARQLADRLFAMDSSPWCPQIF